MSQRAAARLRHGHVWVYRSDVVGEPELPPGALVGVSDERKNLIGTAFWSTSSQIALRMISTGPVDDPATLVRDRIRAAIAFRKELVENSDSYRLVFSEADQLPGVIADKYNNIVTIQFLTQATDQPWFREVFLSTVQEEVAPSSIVERVEERIRELEQLPAKESGLVFGSQGQTTFTLNGVNFGFDALGGQKTGAFLDQRENYAAAAKYAHGEAMDVFTYQGGFALHLARVCDSVIAVDSSRAALEMAEKNESLNSFPKPIEWTEANAFDLLKDWSSTGRQFDTVVLDPPAFAKGRKDLGSALRGYKEINLRALKMLRPGGVLVTCSCSHHVSETDFVDAIRDAASDARRLVRVLEKRGQAKDHPVLLGVPETAYLKCVILRA
ncbi:MAG TPA: class I SAM-dependent rRNA methyltransferase [Terriglobales bacterium]|nr:class I SAM-dependent rRNA methyltransferase [Terriglobales bacterium]